MFWLGSPLVSTGNGPLEHERMEVAHLLGASGHTIQVSRRMPEMAGDRHHGVGGMRVNLGSDTAPVQVKLACVVR